MDARPAKRARPTHHVGAIALWKQSMRTLRGAFPLEMDQTETDFQTYQLLALALALRHHNITDDLGLAVADHIFPLYAQYVAWKQHRQTTYSEQYKLHILFQRVKDLNPTAQRALVRAHVFRNDLCLQGCSHVIPRLTPADAQCFHPVACTPMRRVDARRIRRITSGEAPKHPCTRTWTDCAGCIIDNQWHCIECCLQ